MLLFKARPRKDPALSAQLTPSERRMMATLRDTRAEIQGKFRARRADIMRALLHSPITQIVRLIPTDPWYEAQAMLQAELQAELLDAGRRVKLPPIQKATIAYRFDADRPEAAGWAAKEAGSLIQDITNDQVTFVRDIVSRSQFGEFTPAQAARVFRQMEDGLGLTMQQSEWVENFRQRRITDAMSRGRSYEQAESEAAKPTARYADRVYRYRTETIARTEIMRASNEGRNQAWAQGIEGGWIAPDSLKKWSVERDGRECSICRPLGDLEPIPINASFPQGDPPVHPNCRCTVVLTDEIPADLAQMTDDELEAEISRLLADPDRRGSSTDITEAGIKAFYDAGYEMDEITQRFNDASRGKGAYRELYDGQAERWEDLATEQGERDPLDAVSAWGSGDYRQINAAMAGEIPRRTELRQSGMTVDSFVDKMDTTFDYVDPMRRDIVVERLTGSHYPNVGELLNAPAGSRFVSPHYMATTMQPLDDLSLGGFGGDVEMEILVPRGERALHVDAVTFSGTREFEILLDKDSEFLLLEAPVRQENGRWKVKLVKVWAN